MKNRLQFYRHYPLFSGDTTTTGRDQAKRWLDNKIKQADFIPLIGEPIVLRYLDENGNKQLILAVGKATGNTTADTTHREYHFIDTAELNENIDSVSGIANTALMLASGVSKDIANYRIILQNMIGDNGIEMEDGSYFESDDPSGCGLYKVYPGTNYISAATSLAKADYLLDTELGEANEKINELSGASSSVQESLNELSGATSSLSANTVAELSGVKNNLNNLSGVVESFSAATDTLVNNIKEGAGLKSDGTYEDASGANFIGEADSLFDADVILDTKLGELCANTVHKIDELSAGTVSRLNEDDNNINALSSATVSLSANTKNYVENIVDGAGLKSDGTYEHKQNAKYITDATSLFQADSILDDKLYELSGNAISTINTLSSGTISLVNDFSANTVSAINTLSSDTVSAINNLSSNTVSAINDLSSNTVASVNQLSGNAHNAILQLSANTMAADQVLDAKIQALEGQTIEGENAVKVNGGANKVISLMISDGDKALTQDVYGLKANLSLEYDSSAKTIYFWGKDNINPISSIDAKDFIKDGMLDTAFVKVADSGDTQYDPAIIVGKTYIVLVFNTDSGKDRVYVSADDLVNIYTVDSASRNYLEINDYTIGAKVNVDNGLAGYEYAKHISAVTNTIIQSAGLNSGNEGGYPVHSGVHYISAATTLDGADVVLDNTIYETRQTIERLSAGTIQLSADTKSAVDELKNEITNLSGGSAGAISELSASVVTNRNGIANLSAATTGLSEEVREISERTTELSGASIQHEVKITTLSGVVETLSAHTVESLSALSISVDERIESGLTFMSGVVQNYVEECLSAINFDEIYEYIDSADTMINERIDEVEETTAAALNELNDRVGYVEDHMTGEYIPLTNYEISSGLTEAELIIDDDDTVNEAFGKIQKQILDNEEAVAAGFNGLNERVNELDDDLMGLSGAVRSFSSATNERLIQTNERTTILSGAVASLSSATVEISGMVQSISAKTSGILTINANGVEQGKYSPSANTTIDLQIIQEVTGADVLLTGYELATGTTEEELAVVATDTVNEAFGKVQKQIYDNESVVAGALNDLNDRITTMSGDMNDNEYVISSAFNDLNDRIITLSGDVRTLSANTKSAIVAAIAGLDSITAVTPGSYITGIAIADGKISGITQAVLPSASGISGDISALSASVVTNQNNISTLSGATVSEFNSAFTAINNLSADTVGYVNSKTNGVLTINRGRNSIIQYSPSASTTADLTGGDIYLAGYQYHYDPVFEIDDTDTINTAFSKVQSYTDEIKRSSVTLQVSGRTIGTYKPGPISSTTLHIDMTGAEVLLTGYEPLLTASSPIAATDTVNQAFGKIQKKADEIDALIQTISGAGDVSQLIHDIGAVSGDVISLSASVINDATNINLLSGSVVNNVTNINNLSAATTALSASVVNNATNISNLSATTLNLSANTYNTISQLSAGTLHLSADTYNTFQQLSGAVINVSGSVVNNATNISNLSAATLNLSAVTLTGVSMNGSNVNVNNHVAVLGTVITAETQLSTATTGTGNAVTGLTVSNHKITTQMGSVQAVISDLDDIRNNALSGASAYTRVNTVSSMTIALSAGTLQLSADTYNAIQQVTGGASKLSHNVTMALSGDVYGSVTTDFSTNDVNINTYKKYQTANTFANLDFAEFLTLISTGGNATLTIATAFTFTLPQNGVREGHVIISNTGSTAITITIANDPLNRLKITGGSTITINAGEIGELNALITYNGSAYTIYIITT